VTDDDKPAVTRGNLAVIGAIVGAVLWISSGFNHINVNIAQQQTATAEKQAILATKIDGLIEEMSMTRSARDKQLADVQAQGEDHEKRIRSLENAIPSLVTNTDAITKRLDELLKQSKEG
jgi:septal ring factor EnvC (AmiA/AmiB activator)